MLPFSVFKRSDRNYYSVAFKNEETGRFLSAISTKMSNEKDAYKAAWQWYKEGVPHKRGNLRTLSFRDTF